MPEPEPQSDFESPPDNPLPAAAEFQTVARVGEIPASEGRAFEVQGQMVAVFFRNGEYFAINDFCPHMGASLAAGAVDEDVVICPWHAWRFRITDGTWCDNPKVKTDSFEVRVVGEEIQVRTAPTKKSR